MQEIQNIYLRPKNLHRNVFQWLKATEQGMEWLFKEKYSGSIPAAQKPLLPPVKEGSSTVWGGRLETRLFWTPGGLGTPLHSRSPTWVSRRGTSEPVVGMTDESSVSLTLNHFSSDFSSLLLKPKRTAKFLAKWQKEHDGSVSVQSPKSHSAKLLPTLKAEHATPSLRRSVAQSLKI